MSADEHVELLQLVSSDAIGDQTQSLNRFGVDPRQGRAWCNWPHSTVVLTCDGTVVCGCGDAFNENPMGDARQQSVLDIWRGDGFQGMRRGMRDGHPAPFCERCGLMEVHPPDFEPPLRPGEVRELRLAVPAGSLTPGRWTGTVDLLQEGLTWFEPLHLDLTVSRAVQ